MGFAGREKRPCEDMERVARQESKFKERKNLRTLILDVPKDIHYRCQNMSFFLLFTYLTAFEIEHFCVHMCAYTSNSDPFPQELSILLLNTGYLHGPGTCESAKLAGCEPHRSAWLCLLTAGITKLHHCAWLYY